MTIDPSKPVKLLKLAVQGGNIYHPRIYNPGDLPEEIMARIDILDQSFLTPPAASSVATPTVNNSDVTIENTVSFSVESPSTIPAAYPTETVVIERPRVDINKATIDDLAKLPLVGVTTATKLDKEREKEPFTSIEDLNSRVPLKGKNWEELKAQILIQ